MPSAKEASGCGHWHTEGKPVGTNAAPGQGPALGGRKSNDFFSDPRPLATAKASARVRVFFQELDRYMQQNVLDVPMQFLREIFYPGRSL